MSNSAGPVVTVAVVDNHEATCRGVETMLAAHADQFEVAGSFADVESLQREVAVTPEVVVLDLRLGRDDLISTPWIESLTAAGSRVLLHTSEERPAILRAAIARGAHGLSLKNDGIDGLYTALCEVSQGGFACSSVLAEALVSDSRLIAALSPREVEVLESLHDGLTRDQVARRLGIGVGTIKTHLESTRQKYLALDRSVTNAASIVREAARDGWID